MSRKESPNHPKKRKNSSSRSSSEQTDDSSILDVKDSLVGSLSKLYLQSTLSDITIVVDGERIPAHKTVLMPQSEFFEVMLNSQMIEAQTSEVELHETPLTIFKLLLKLAYYGHLELDGLEPGDLIQLYELIERYQFVKYKMIFLNKIRSILNPDNVWTIFDQSVMNCYSECVDVCWKYLDEKLVTEKLLFLESFYAISSYSLKQLLNRDETKVKELDLFIATSEWIKHNKDLLDEEKTEIISCIRISLIPYDDFCRFVLDSGLVPTFDLLSALKAKPDISNNEIRNRGVLIRDEFLDSTSAMSLTCHEALKFHVLNGKVGDQKAETNSKWKREFSERKSGILIKFGFPLTINYIQMTMSTLKGDRFLYRVDYSPDSVTWKTLYDYSRYPCSNSQTLYFQSIVAQYFHIFGHHQMRMDSSSKTEFDSIENFFCCWQNREYFVERIDGLLSSPPYVHKVQDRIYHDNKATIDANDRYYIRSLSSNKPITVALDQPVMIDSFSFQLWDKDDRAYSYVVEIFDGTDWITVTDKSHQKCQSWQVISFNRRPVIFANVRGIRAFNTDSTEFRIIKFRFPHTANLRHSTLSL